MKVNRFSDSDMSKVGVKILDKDRITLECQECGQRWYPCLRKGGTLPRHYWHCPNNCNTRT